MTLMKKITTIFISILLTTGCFAQKDKMATEILDRVIAKTESHKTIEVEFAYSMDNVEADIHETKKGKLLVMGDKYRLNIAEQIVISDGETLWTLLMEDKEVMINLLNSYGENYKSKYMKEDQVDGKTVDLIELTPLEGKTYSKIELAIEKNLDRIYSFSIYDKNGSTYSYVINKYTANIPVNEFAFTFNEADYPDFEIVDMR